MVSSRPELFRGPRPDETIVKKIQQSQSNAVALSPTPGGSLNQSVIHWPTRTEPGHCLRTEIKIGDSLRCFLTFLR
jgi:hypothetical protein